mmetsp:Transcript_19715/g.28695  ORF Transcript_19715/g.28695 Transcript_19715/m.28695 type:complete len:337 (-) Transcript_19715:31-1041(-)
MREFVVIVVIAFSKGNQRGNDMVIGGVFSRVGLAPQRVSKGVHTESCLVNDERSTHASIHHSSPEVIPAERGHHNRENKGKADRDWEVVLVLPHYEFVLVQISDIDSARAPLFLLEHHPANMSVPEPLMNCIRVLLGIHISVMGSVVSTPPPDGAFKRCSTPASENQLHKHSGFVALMGPQPVVSRSNAKSTENILEKREYKRLPLEFNKAHAPYEGNQGREDNSRRQPVYPLQERQILQISFCHILRRFRFLVNEAMVRVIHVVRNSSHSVNEFQRMQKENNPTNASRIPIRKLPENPHFEVLYRTIGLFPPDGALSASFRENRPTWHIRSSTIG